MAQTLSILDYINSEDKIQYINAIDIFPNQIIKNNGVITIGTTTVDTSYILNVNGNVKIDGDIFVQNVKNINNNIIYANQNHNHTTNSLNETGFTIDSANGRLGINGTNSSYNLHVNGSINATTIYDNGTALNSIYQSKSSGVIIDIYEIELEVHPTAQESRYNFPMDSSATKTVWWIFTDDNRYGFWFLNRSLSGATNNDIKNGFGTLGLILNRKDNPLWGYSDDEETRHGFTFSRSTVQINVYEDNNCYIRMASNDLTSIYDGTLFCIRYIYK